MLSGEYDFAVDAGSVKDISGSDCRAGGPKPTPEVTAEVLATMHEYFRLNRYRVASPHS
jgi:hypothetical protein